MSLWTILQVMRALHPAEGISKHHMSLHTLAREALTRSCCCLQGFLLFANGFAILNNERFLEPCKQAHSCAVANLAATLFTPTSWMALQMALGSHNWEGGTSLQTPAP